MEVFLGSGANLAHEGVSMVVLPIFEISAHYCGFVVRVLEAVPEDKGSFAKRVGMVSFCSSPTLSWLAANVSLSWLMPLAGCLLSLAVCGYFLEHYTEDC